MRELSVMCVRVRVRASEWVFIYEKIHRQARRENQGRRDRSAMAPPYGWTVTG